jgi:hypothetical protein
MSATQSSKDFTVMSIESTGRALAGDRVCAVCGSRVRPTVRRSVVRLGPAQASLSTATARAGRVPAIGCMVGACGTARKPLASLGLGLTAALRVRWIPPLAPVAALSGTRPAPRGHKRARRRRDAARSPPPTAQVGAENPEKADGPLRPVCSLDSTTTEASDLQDVHRWRDPDSNRGHHDFQTDALNTRTQPQSPANERLLERGFAMRCVP